MSMPKRIYLVSKTLDPLLGIFSGIWAYYVYESRLERPSEHSLPSLLRWKMGEIKQRRNAAAGAGDLDEQGWKELDEEVRRLQATQSGTEKR
ncbi:BZ3500_MvSof-1268-A1-R1_Chr3-1g05455 [Microbotryum saponariae]|uniref:BZ3500_MvSof-1268-A1-R1_Chr3-1g05455 protein n=1 Tax=Microbotryum saponariae TaxID=289078 RepID=A0A2X0NGK0_9BASI|nr:BZ3500_MvSof-1268-A1-R1_Chr3-1g05455 [Microbotryum saponariae]SDA04646.1 BZ3501_MvSof-1269-A2-R1_Chr3-1g05126 [Microbotryum saponariae]